MHSTPATGRVAGKVAIVAGAGSGLGEATAKRLAKEIAGYVLPLVWGELAQVKGTVLVLDRGATA